MAVAAEIDRGNPFEAPPAYAQEQAKLDERIRTIFGEMQPVMTNDIMRQVKASEAGLEIRLNNRINILDRSTDAAAQSGNKDSGKEGQSAPKQAAKTDIPTDAKFVACVNKGALYRDSNNIIFKVPETDPKSVANCAR